jgi:uncharacterized membrane protein
MSVFKKIVRNWDLGLVILFCLIYTLALSNFSILRHEAFFSNFDLANMAQTIWNTLHGHFFELSDNGATVSRFSIHFDPIMVLMAPLYLIWNNVKVILVFQSLALGSAGIAVFLLSKKIIGKIKSLNPAAVKIFAVTLTAAYLLNPYLEWSNTYDFHPVTLFIPLFLFAFYFMLGKRWLPFWILIALCLITKEEIGIIVGILGIFMFLFFGEKKHGALVFVIGIAVSLLAVFWVIPHFSPGGIHWALNSLYTPARQKLKESKTIPMLLDVLRGYFLIPRSITYYLKLLKPFSFLPILGLPFLIFTGPEIAVNMMSTDPQMQSLTLHYTSGITPFLVLATVYGVFYLISFLGKDKVTKKSSSLVLILISIVLLYSSVRANYHDSPMPYAPACWCQVYQVTDQDRQVESVLMKIPENASITASGEIRPHLALRVNSFSIPGGMDADYVALFIHNRILYDRSQKDFESQLLKNKEFLSSHTLQSNIGDFYLFKKND